jgi:lipid-A-disaccharide synthase
MEVDYVGNPLLDAVAAFKADEDFIKKNNLLSNKKIIALLPGSRRQEINYLLPGMVQITDKFPEYQFVIAGAPSFNINFYLPYIGNKNIPIIFNATYNLLNNAYAAVVASGTATLEAALFNVPQVVVYKGNAVSIGIARLVVSIKYISLVNLIMDKPVVKELIQQDCSPEKISAELDNIINNPTYRDKMLADYNELDKKMGNAGASVKTADLIIKYAAKK